MQRTTSRRRWVWGLLGLSASVWIALAGLTIANWPALAAQGSDVIRMIVGDRVVATLENDFYLARDSLHQLEQTVRPAAPNSPWAGEASTAASAPIAPNAQPGSHTAQHAAVVAPTPWNLPSLSPLSAARGEGLWTPLTLDPAGRPVVAKTFLHPDLQRPYAYAAVVALDLSATRLHFVLGYDEPASPVQVSRPGRIPAGDLQPGALLAAFNGGFKARHGDFGAMVDGVTVLPPRQDLGTVAIYADGHVALGAWGTDFGASPDMVAWRQNGPLLIRHGVAADPATTDTPAVWGEIVGGKTATWRSGLGLSADGRTLYYAVGPSLTLASLTRTLLLAGSANAIQLDMNDYWVHFDSFQTAAGREQPKPLLAEMATQGDKRFLDRYSRDFFYLTSAP
jgi:hypothetical protein